MVRAVARSSPASLYNRRPQDVVRTASIVCATLGECGDVSMLNDPGGRGGGEAPRVASGVVTGLTPGRARVVLSAVAPTSHDDLAGLTLELGLLKCIKAKQGKDETAFSVWKHGQVAPSKHSAIAYCI